MAQQRMSDERLCWLAVRDELRRRSWRQPALLIVAALVLLPLLGYLAASHAGVFFGGLLAVVAVFFILRRANRQLSNHMTSYSIPVHDTVTELSPAERQHLQETGEVPDWFLQRVLKRR